jgi:diadenylate cyclase
MHDGAVVIQGDRVAAAGCYLPLTENPNLNKQLGTRHRAALGVSEQSDALAFVVSEETGVISMAKDGKLTRYLGEKGLTEILMERYTSEEEMHPLTIWNRWFRPEGKKKK